MSAQFDAFTRLLVLQALWGFGYAPARHAVRFADGPMRLHGPRGELSLRPSSDGTIVLEQGARVLPIVALPISPAGDATVVVEAIALVARDTLVFLHGRVPTNVEGHAAAALSGWSRPQVLLVSPWSLDAIERTARALGAWDAAGRLERFPPRVPWKGAPPAALPDWVRAVDGALIAVRPPGQGDEEKPASVAVTLRPRGAADDGEQARTGALRSLRMAAEAIGWLACCPVCDGSEVVFDERFRPGAPIELQTIWGRCGGCAAAWGLRACGRCLTGRFVMLNPGVNLPCPADVASLDRTYGRDLWSRPQRAEDGAPVFSCPCCGG